MMTNNIVKTHHGYIIRDRDMELARYKYYFDRTMDSIFDVCCRYTGLIVADVNKELDRMVKNFYTDDADIPLFLVKEFDTLILLSYLDDEHCGDCTKYPMTCMRCYVERLIGCNTMLDNSPYFPEGEISCEYQFPI